MPDHYLHPQPWHISFFFELFFGRVILIKYKKVSAFGLIILLIAVFPANIYLATSKVAYEAIETSQQMAILRLSIQFLFMVKADFNQKRIRSREIV